MCTCYRHRPQAQKVAGGCVRVCASCACTKGHKNVYTCVSLRSQRPQSTKGSRWLCTPVCLLPAKPRHKCVFVCVCACVCACASLWDPRPQSAEDGWCRCVIGFPCLQVSNLFSAKRIREGVVLTNGRVAYLAVAVCDVFVLARPCTHGWACIPIHHLSGGHACRCKRNGCSLCSWLFYGCDRRCNECTL